jgi:hypothetical protein
MLEKNPEPNLQAACKQILKDSKKLQKQAELENKDKLEDEKGDDDSDDEEDDSMGDNNNSSSSSTNNKNGKATKKKAKKEDAMDD